MLRSSSFERFFLRRVRGEAVSLIIATARKAARRRGFRVRQPVSSVIASRGESPVLASPARRSVNRVALVAASSRFVVLSAVGVKPVLARAPSRARRLSSHCRGQHALLVRARVPATARRGWPRQHRRASVVEHHDAVERRPSPRRRGAGAAVASIGGQRPKRLAGSASASACASPYLSSRVVGFGDVRSAIPGSPLTLATAVAPSHACATHLLGSKHQCPRAPAYASAPGSLRTERMAGLEIGVPTARSRTRSVQSPVLGELAAELSRSCLRRCEPERLRTAATPHVFDRGRQLPRFTGCGSGGVVGVGHDARFGRIRRRRSCTRRSAASRRDSVGVPVACFGGVTHPDTETTSASARSSGRESKRGTSHGPVLFQGSAKR
jgi:hypothetical protein